MMLVLEKTLRNKLERTVMEARDVAEAAAHSVVEQLGVGEPKAYAHLSNDEKELRRKLRIHGRQLGDVRYAKTETQEIDRLAEEIAYEHWHRMLFARFLAENNLLMYPDPEDPVAVSLEECEDLAAEEGAKNGWELAARFAARMLPQIFRPDSPVFQLELPPEHQQKLERLLAELPQEVFHASDSLGWVYQFWQAKKKDEVNASEVKIGARELPAVTQLFTEPYMVAFLLDNSLGAWWAARRLTEDDLKNVKTEDELRRKASLPGVPLEYLRFIKGEDGKWTPAAGTFDGWPEALAELKTLDPCCGSGHFLVAACLMLVPMRLEMEGLSACEAVDRVLAENIHGLEIDQRCVELAAFALAIAAWRYPDSGGYRQLPELNVACSGLSLSVGKGEWKKLANGQQNLSIALDWLYDVFKQAPVLGSLLNPTKTDAANLVEWDQLEQSLIQALAKEKDDETYEMGVVVFGLARAARLLSGSYHWVITNVPYLARGRHNDILKQFCERHYGDAKQDLATIMLCRCLDFCHKGGTASLVLPQNWLFLNSYKSLRKRLLKEHSWCHIGKLGTGAFETISGAVVNVALIAIRQEPPAAEILFSGSKISDHLFAGIDSSSESTAQEKAAYFLSGHVVMIPQGKQLENPDAIIKFELSDPKMVFKRFARCNQGIGTADASRFICKFWEVADRVPVWDFYQMAPDGIHDFSGLHSYVRWDNGKGPLATSPQARVCGQPAWGRRGVGAAVTSDLKRCHYLGYRFDCTLAAITALMDEYAEAVVAYVSHGLFVDEVRKVDQALSVTESSFLKVPFDATRWTSEAQRRFPNGLPKPYSDDPTQWIFHGHPANTEHSLQVAVARLLGYAWPAELDAGMELCNEASAQVSKCDTLLKFADKDGIVCIAPVRGEASAADRLLNIIAAAYGDYWSTKKLSELLKQADHADKTLDSWLRDKFFAQHCQLFHHRPFIWHIWDGIREGFAALVNYHKLDRKNLETLIYTYLGDWIKRQKDDIASGVDGAEEFLAAAETLKKRLELILEGEAPYDIFIRWKSIKKQPIGWDPDLDDGVRLNIRPFMTVADVRKKGAGILRDKPNIHWKKDRGKDVESAPWYHLFKGNRINDFHLSLDEKCEAREAVKEAK